LKEIAQVTGVPPETVKSRLRYALAKLRRGLAPGFEAAGFKPVSVQP
jgi:DNA-directed RNA polymerase specialized sigma24 family protein